MDANEKTITLFTTRMRQLVLQYSELKKANQSLRKEQEALEAKVKELQGRLACTQQEYESLKMAKMMEITDGDYEGAQKRLSKLIRDVNKCITLLSDK